MGSRPSPRGHALASGGAGAVAVSLWLPWYSFRIPGAAIDSAVQAAHQLGLPAPLIAQGAQAASRLGTLHVTAWKAYTTLPAILLVCAAIGGGLALLSLTEHAEGVDPLVTLAGVVAAGLVVFRLLSPPLNGQLLSPTWGLFVALGGSLAMVAGGTWAARADDRPGELPDLAPTPARRGWSTTHSVPPPSSG